jgi:hypothetical protein
MALTTSPSEHGSHRTLIRARNCGYRCHRADAGGVTVWVVGYEDLLRMKEASGRAQDLLDIEELRAQRELSGD